MNTPEIKVTEDYQLFKAITGNRLVNKNKIEKIALDIQSGLNMLPYCPIVVYKNEDYLNVVDGQHRLKAAILCEQPIYYVECDKLELNKIARINSRSDKWKNSDFIQCYIQLGLEDYVVLHDFISEYKINYSSSVSMLMLKEVREGGGTKSMESFRDGEFVVNYLDWSKSLADKTLEIFGRYKFWNDRGLLGAVNKLIIANKCDFEVLKDKIKAAPNLMEKKSNYKEYLYLIEKVYNYKNSKRVTLF